MRPSVLVAVCCVVLAAADESQRQAADNDFLQKQQKVLQLLLNPHQQNYNAEVFQAGQSHNPRDHAGDYTNSRAVKEFINQLKEGFLNNDDTYRPTNLRHYHQLVTIFDLFYFAKDFETFYKSAAYVRQHVNSVLYDGALRAAVLHRPDTKGIHLPPFSDTHPFYFVDSRAIQEAQYHKQRGHKQGTFYQNFTSNQQHYQDEYEHGRQHNYENPNFPFNYESAEQQQNYYNQYNLESQLSYYTDDIQLNDFNFYFYLLNIPFFNPQKYGVKNYNEVNGEEFYYYLQQSLARYNLERNSHYFPNVRPIQFNQPIRPGYNPNLQAPNGQSFSPRPNQMHFQDANTYYYNKLRNVERRLQDAVDSEYMLAADGSKVALTAENGVEILGKAVSGNAESVNMDYYTYSNGEHHLSYFKLFLKTVGGIADPYHTYGAGPGALRFYSTAHRDPVYYQIVARVVRLFQNFKDKIQPYTQDQIFFPEVKVQNFQVDDLETYYDSRDVDLYSALQYGNGEELENFDYKVHHYELNHKPFNYHVNVQSSKDVEAIVRVFIGPKYNVNGQSYSLEQARKSFVEFDRFVTQLKNGENKIERNSKQSHIFVEHQPDTRSLFRQLKQASQGADKLYFYKNPNNYAGFPQNLLLPRGNRAGQEFTMFVTVNKYEPRQNYHGNSFYPHVDNHPFGFPFDRRVIEEYFEKAPNVHFQTVKVYHKTVNEVNKNQ